MSGTFQSGPLRPSTRPYGGANSWGPYWDALFPPDLVTPWINFKRLSTRVNIARRLRDQREYLRHTYELVNGSDPAAWPSQHPGVVLDAVLWMAHPACLRCHWFDVPGHYMKRPDDLKRALILARHHEMSDGAFRPMGLGRTGRHREIPEEGRRAHEAHIAEIQAEQLRKNAALPDLTGLPTLPIAPRYAHGRLLPRDSHRTSVAVRRRE